ncbi:aquaporin-11 isoform X2 [Ornithorhynchus anatinus]|uniref:aquaporin-11 isoform X2 n=1 Tax=Ornithorhynchus anatinus TaxID=9258 RepID=UPI0010A7C637|nr:aquaporin-11 isoform X2 [Ornithorhynchus anatinus]
MAGGVGDTCVSLGLMAGTVVLVGVVRGLWEPEARRLRPLVLELLATFQLCACTHELVVQARLDPSPHLGLTLSYLSSLVHGLTLPGALANPCAVLHKVAAEGLAVRTALLKVAAQVAGALLARAYALSVRSLGLAERHRPDRRPACRPPLPADVPRACLVEAICSFIYHSAVVQFRDVRPKLRVHLLAALVTFLVFAGKRSEQQDEVWTGVGRDRRQGGGGSITGAVFNPALALSLHMKCFQGEFHNFAIVYWVGPTAGIAMMVLMYRFFLPWLNRKRSLKFE